MELDSQIETLEEIGFRFRDRKVIQKLLDCHAWWQYHESPFTLLMERLNFWAACNQTRLCLNLVSWDFKGLRHNGWFKSIATDLAELSSSQTGFKIANLTENREDDVWRMEYRLPSKLGPLTREIITRFPYKHASWLPVIEMAADFATESHCFFNFSNDEPSLCWLPKNQVGKLNQILPGQFQTIPELAG